MLTIQSAASRKPRLLPLLTRALSCTLWFCRNALLKRSLQAHRLLVLLEEVGKRLIGNVLKAASAFAGHRLYCGPGFVIKLNALTDHWSSPTNLGPQVCSAILLHSSAWMRHSSADFNTPPPGLAPQIVQRLSPRAHFADTAIWPHRIGFQRKGLSEIRPKLHLGGRAEAIKNIAEETARGEAREGHFYTNRG